MRKVLLLLLSLIIIGVSTSLCFINKAPSIRDDLISQAESIYKVKNIRGLKVELKGQDLTTQRVLILTGSVSTEQERIDAQRLAENIEGVIGVENEIIIKEKEKISLKIETKQSASNNIATPKTVVLAVEPTPLPTELTKKINAIQEIVEEKTIPVIEVPVLIELMPQQPSVPNITNVIKVPIAIQKMVDVPIPVQAISPPVAIKVKEINSSVKLNIKGVK